MVRIAAAEALFAGVRSIRAAVGFAPIGGGGIFLGGAGPDRWCHAHGADPRKSGHHFPRYNWQELVTDRLLRMSLGPLGFDSAL